LTSEKSRSPSSSPVRVFVAGLGRVFQFAHFFFDFAPDRLDVGPIETQMRGSSRDALGAGQCRHRLGNVAERRFRLARFSLAGFDLQPLLQTAAVSSGIGSPANT
jgi:hypothetical protein